MVNSLFLDQLIDVLCQFSLAWLSCTLVLDTSKTINHKHKVVWLKTKNIKNEFSSSVATCRRRSDGSTEEAIPSTSFGQHSRSLLQDSLVRRSEVFYIPQAVRKNCTTYPAASSQYGRREVYYSKLEIFVGRKSIRTGITKKTICSL